MNKVFLIGNLTRDPELSETSGGIAVCHFAMAVNRNYQSSDGTRETDFFNITVWRAQAENCAKYLKKGSKVAIIGSLQNRSYEDKGGVKRTVTEVAASEVEFLTTKNSSGDDKDSAPRKSSNSGCNSHLEPVDDDKLPF